MRPEPDLQKLLEMPYKEYLLTDHWQQVRMEALQRSDHSCQLCKNAKNLHVHHNTYKRRGAELPSDLIVLCKGCHEKFHDIMPDEEN